MRGEFTAALDDTLLALKILGVEVDAAPSARKAERMFTEVENEILAVGHDEILSLTRASDPRHLLAIQLLNDAGTNAYWSPSPNFAEIIGLTVSHLRDVSSHSDGRYRPSNKRCGRSRQAYVTGFGAYSHQAWFSSRYWFGVFLGTRR